MRKNREETLTILNNMKIIQRNDFQNFTLDSVLLSDFVKINRKTKKILDIGTGCGIIPLILGNKSTAEIIGIELYNEMSKIAEKNIEYNNLSERIKIVNEDIRNYTKIFKKDEFDSIVTNPPYFEYKGDINQTNNLKQLAFARHNIDLTIDRIIEISSYLLKNRGSFSMVFRSDRLTEIVSLLTNYNLEPKRMRICYTKKKGNAKICLIEAIKDAKKGLIIEEAVYVYNEKGEKSIYIENLYGKEDLKCWK